MLVVPRVLRLLGDLVDDVPVIELSLAAEAGIWFHVVGSIEVVRFAVLHFRERFETFLHPDVAGGAGADSAARRAVLGAELLRSLEQRGPFGHFAFGFQLPARVVDGHLGHQSTGCSARSGSAGEAASASSAAYAFRACGESSP